MLGELAIRILVSNVSKWLSRREKQLLLRVQTEYQSLPHYPQFYNRIDVCMTCWEMWKAQNRYCTLSQNLLERTQIAGELSGSDSIYEK